MRKSIAFLALIANIFLSGALKGQEILEEKKHDITVLSYNIWNGFDWGKDTLRKKKVLEWITLQQPDVVALQELCGYTKEKLLEDAQAWGHRYVEILKTSGYPVGLTSNQPIKVKEKILENLHHGALHCQIGEIDFMVVHFSPFSHKKRHEEAQVILARLAAISKVQDKFIVLGDFNAVSPFDADYYQGNEELLKSKRESEEKHDHVRNLSNGELEYAVMSRYISFPLIDVVQKHTSGLDQRISCPTQIFEKEKGKGRPVNSTRIDYILTSPFLGTICKGAYVANDEETFYLSDHYPVIAKFEY